jgi:glycosyltransferase involved in cell wall biosynthesis
MSQADVGMVLPIWEDNGPQVAMEFVNNCVPVLGTRRGGVPDIVSEDSGFLFDPDDKGELDAAVHWIERISHAEISSIAAAMRRLITPQQHADRISELYHQALERT